MPLFIGLFVIVGVGLLIATRAATTSVSYEVESASLSGATKITDSTASGSQAIAFSGTTPTPPPPPPSGTWPSDATTGYKACGKTLSQLTPMSGVLKPGDNAVIENFDLTGYIDVVGKNVIIRCGRIRTTGLYAITSSNRVGDYIADSVEMQGTAAEGSTGTNSAAVVHYGTWTLRKVNAWRFRDGIKIGTNQTLEDSWIHDLWRTSGSHNDGIQSVGGSGSKILRNRIEGPWQQSTSAMILGNMSNYLIEGNFVSGGGYSIYIGGKADGNPPTNIKVRNNVFNGYTKSGCCDGKAGQDTRNSWRYGVYSFPNFSWPANDPGAEWSGNTFIDGTTLTR